MLNAPLCMAYILAFPTFFYEMQLMLTGGMNDSHYLRCRPLFTACCHQTAVTESDGNHTDTNVTGTLLVSVVNDSTIDSAYIYTHTRGGGYIGSVPINVKFELWRVSIWLQLREAIGNWRQARGTELLFELSGLKVN